MAVFDLSRAFNRRMGGAGIRRNLRSATRVQSASLEAPETISNLFAWWRGDHGTTVATGVSTWADRVSGRTLSQGTGGAQPALTTHADLGGQDCLSFDGTDDTLVSDDAASTWSFLHNGTGGTVFIVLRTGSAGFRDSWIATSTFGGLTRGVYLGSWNTPDRRYYVHSGSAQVVAASLAGYPAANTAGWRLGSYSTAAGGVYAQSGSISSVAETSAPSASAPVSTLLVMSDGGSRWAQGHLAEIIVYSKALSGAERTTLANYANTRYGVAA